MVSALIVTPELGLEIIERKELRLIV